LISTNRIPDRTSEHPAETPAIRRMWQLRHISALQCDATSDTVGTITAFC
jgi:hypothetical protein